MKKIVNIFSIVALSLLIVSCFDDEATTTEPDVKPIRFDTLSLEYQNVKYSCGSWNPITCTLPYGADITSLRLYFTVDDSFTVYINNIPQVSGENVYDFTNGITYVMVDEYGNERTDKIVVVFAENTEANIYSVSVLVDSSEYVCDIAEADKKITVDISDKTKSQLESVKFKFVISDNATFIINGNWITSEVSTANIALFLDSNTIKVRAEDKTYETVFDFIVKCIDCGN